MKLKISSKKNKQLITLNCNYMNTGNKGIELIKSFEGCMLKAYKCSANKTTIGYGNTFYEDGSPVKLEDEITTERAEELLKSILEKFEKTVKAKIKVPLNQNQFDALVSYFYNTGGSETLVKLINTSAPEDQIKTWFTTKYITANGKQLQGLVRRRKAECDLYFSV